MTPIYWADRAGNVKLEPRDFQSLAMNTRMVEKVADIVFLKWRANGPPQASEAAKRIRAPMHSKAWTGATNGATPSTGTAPARRLSYPALHVEVISLFIVLGDVQAFGLILGADAQSDNLVNALEQQIGDRP